MTKRAAESLPPPFQRNLRDDAYFIDDETLVKVELRLLPTPCMAAMAATAISAAMRPYSMAVAPLLLLISLRTNCIFRSPRFHSSTEIRGIVRCPSGRERVFHPPD